MDPRFGPVHCCAVCKKLHARLADVQYCGYYKNHACSLCVCDSQECREHWTEIIRGGLCAQAWICWEHRQNLDEGLDELRFRIEREGIPKKENT